MRQGINLHDCLSTACLKSVKFHMVYLHGSQEASYQTSMAKQLCMRITHLVRAETRPNGHDERVTPFKGTSSTEG
jgi:hypothetical protein